MLVGKKKILFIDEAHKIPEIGLVLKRAWDKLKNLQVVASGSSSVELADKIEEPMTGRKLIWLRKRRNRGFVRLNLSEIRRKRSAHCRRPSAPPIRKLFVAGFQWRMWPNF